MKEHHDRDGTTITVMHVPASRRELVEDLVLVFSLIYIRDSDTTLQVIMVVSILTGVIQ